MPVSGSAKSRTRPPVVRRRARRRRSATRRCRSPARTAAGRGAARAVRSAALRVAELEIAARRKVDAALQRDGACGRRRGGSIARDGPPATKPRSTSTARPSSSSERRDDVEADAARVHLVVDQDLVARIELAGQRHRAKAPRAPVGDAGRQRQPARHRRRRSICACSASFSSMPPVLPVAARHAQRRSSRTRRPWAPTRAGARAVAAASCAASSARAMADRRPGC